MKAIVIAFLLPALHLLAQGVSFQTVRTMVPDGKKVREKRVELVFANHEQLLVKSEDRALVTIPFSKIDKIDYEFAKRHRTGEGAAVMALSLGAGAIVMLTKTTSHWMGVEFQEDGRRKQLLLRLDKSDYRSVIAAAESQTGKKVEMLASTKGPEAVTKGSHNVAEVVSYPVDRVEAALRQAMERYTCRVTKTEPGSIECSRPVDGEVYKGEHLLAKFNAEGEGTRVLIETHKGFTGRAVKKNWSAPVFQEMMRALKEDQQASARRS